jgi:putative membrane protein
MSAAPPPRADDTPLRLAVETTLLLWVRTGIALMAFGFFVARLGLIFEEWDESEVPHTGRGAGVGFVLAGCATCLLAAGCHYRFLRRLPPSGRELPATLPWGLAVAVAVALVGLALAASLAWGV